MSLSIKRGSKAPDLEGVTQGKAYPVLALTHDHVVILNEDDKLVAVSFTKVNGGEDWSLASTKPAKAEK